MANPDIENGDYFLINDAGTNKKVTAETLKNKRANAPYKDGEMLVAKGTTGSNWPNYKITASELDDSVKLTSDKWMMVYRGTTHYRVNGDKVVDYFGSSTWKAFVGFGDYDHVARVRKGAGVFNYVVTGNKGHFAYSSDPVAGGFLESALIGATKGQMNLDVLQNTSLTANLQGTCVVHANEYRSAPYNGLTRQESIEPNWHYATSDPGVTIAGSNDGGQTFEAFTTYPPQATVSTRNPQGLTLIGVRDCLDGQSGNMYTAPKGASAGTYSSITVGSSGGDRDGVRNSMTFISLDAIGADCIMARQGWRPAGLPRMKIGRDANGYVGLWSWTTTLPGQSYDPLWAGITKGGQYNYTFVVSREGKVRGFSNPSDNNLNTNTGANRAGWGGTTETSPGSRIYKEFSEFPWETRTGATGNSLYELMKKAENACSAGARPHGTPFSRLGGAGGFPHANKYYVGKDQGSTSPGDYYSYIYDFECIPASAGGVECLVAITSLGVWKTKAMKIPFFAMEWEPVKFIPAAGGAARTISCPNCNTFEKDQPWRSISYHPGTKTVMMVGEGGKIAVSKLASSGQAAGNWAAATLQEIDTATKVPGVNGKEDWQEVKYVQDSRVTGGTGGQFVIVGHKSNGGQASILMTETADF